MNDRRYLFGHLGKKVLERFNLRRAWKVVLVIALLAAVVINSDLWQLDLADPPTEAIMQRTNDLELRSNVTLSGDGFDWNGRRYDGSLPSMWTCDIDFNNTVDRKKKLIFIHVFKAAGSSFRDFFLFYGRVCHKGVSIIIHCSTVSLESIGSQTSVWRTAVEPCEGKLTTGRDGEVIAQHSNVSNAFLTKNEIDIAIGHFPAGIDRNWFADGQEEHDTPELVDGQYVVFFRDPFAKYVSGRLYVNQHKHWSFAEAVDQIKRKVVTEHEKGVSYERYSDYLLTPSQKEKYPSREAAVQQVKSNLVDMRMMVGVVERMADSIALLQYIIDGSKDLTKWFSFLDLDSTHSKRTTTLQSNQSELSTTKIVKELQKDEAFVGIMKDYLRYEIELYAFAIRLHEQQVYWLQDQRNK